MSRNDIVLFACGSRSMRSVFLLRSANAAARLIAVVVLPTPPFWLAIAMTMLWSRPEAPEKPAGSSSDSRSVIGPCQAGLLHLVAQIVRIEAFQPLLKPLLVRLLGRDIHGLGLVEHAWIHKD